ncbi:MAG TPA: ABC transporter ATP-binding protein, partial [Microbacterium sp.]|nr:ABC transporter ATP-binding protein [Microbacterium sp.]
MNTTGTASAVIELTDVRRHFGSGDRRVQAVDGVTLRVERGEVVALLGPNGAGKTTTLDMLLGLTPPSSGSVTVLGGHPDAAAKSGSIAAVLQTGGLLGDVTVRETVELIASLHGRTALSRVPDVMSRADLTHLAARKVSKCSGGEQQRVKFALAMVPDPDILVLDEPTAGMDVTARRHFWDVMRADADAGRTIVFATHYLEEAEQFARRTVVMHRGTIVADA